MSPLLTDKAVKLRAQPLRPASTGSGLLPGPGCVHVHGSWSMVPLPTIHPQQRFLTRQRLQKLAFPRGSLHCRPPNTQMRLYPKSGSCGVIDARELPTRFMSDAGLQQPIYDLNRATGGSGKAQDTAQEYQAHANR